MLPLAGNVQKRGTLSEPSFICRPPLAHVGAFPPGAKVQSFPLPLVSCATAPVVSVKGSTAFAPGISVFAGTAAPTPVSASAAGVDEAFVRICNVAARLPPAVGVKKTDSVHVAPGERAVVQVLRWL